MMGVTYNIPDIGLLGLISVRPRFLPVFYTTNNLFVSKTPLSPLRFSVSLAVITLSLILPFIFRRNIRDKDGNPIPPGPLLRRAVIRPYPERVLRDWSRTYGPLFSVWMGDQLFVVISDARIAKDLLVSNGVIFSSRKPYFMNSQMMLRGLSVAATPYNDTW
jgi:hypothetical protein